MSSPTIFKTRKYAISSLCQYTAIEWHSKTKELASRGDLLKYDTYKECTRSFLSQSYEDSNSCDQQTSSTETRVHITLREVVEYEVYNHPLLYIWLCVLCFHVKPLAKQV